mgnify:CR=1
MTPESTKRLVAIGVANMHMDHWTLEELKQFAFDRLTEELLQLSNEELKAELYGFSPE